MFKYIIFLVHVLLILVGVLEYEVWSQISYIANMTNVSVASAEEGLIVHLPRFMVVYPAIFLSDFLGFDQGIIYGLYISLLALLASSFMYSVGKNYAVPESANTLLSATPLFIAFVANGRIIFGLAGLTGMVYVLDKGVRQGINFSLFCMSILALLFSSVSSGIFSVAFSFAVFFMWRYGKHHIKSIPRILKSLITLLFLGMVYFFMIFLRKNYSYYAEMGSGLDMISHGLGMIVNPMPLLSYCETELNNETRICKLVLTLQSITYGWLLAMFIVSAVMFMIITYLIRSRNIYVFKSMVLLSCLGGVFGFTTLFSFLSVVNLFLAEKELDVASINPVSKEIEGSQSAEKIRPHAIAT